MSSTQYLEDSERDEIISRLKKVQENDKCIECLKKNTKWASVNLGLYICFDCSGKHRQFGPKLSLVRSLNLDSWTRRQVIFMENGGNQKFIDYMKKNGALSGNSRTIDWENNPVVKRYKAELAKIVDRLEAGSKPNEVQQQPQQQQQQQQEVQQQQEQKVEEKKQEDDKKEDFFSNNLSTTAKVTTSNVIFATKKNGNQKGNKKIKAEKIDDFDWNQLTFDDGVDNSKNTKNNRKTSGGSDDNKKNDFQLYEESNENNNNNEKSDPFAFNSNNNASSNNTFGSSSNNYNSSNNQENLNKLKDKNCKSISSANFFNNEETSSQDKTKLQGFGGSQAISSNMYFNREEEPEAQGGENIQKLQDFFWNLKDKSSEMIGKVKQNWK